MFTGRWLARFKAFADELGKAYYKQYVEKLKREFGKSVGAPCRMTRWWPSASAVRVTRAARTRDTDPFSLHPRPRVVNGPPCRLAADGGMPPPHGTWQTIDLDPERVPPRSRARPGITLAVERPFRTMSI